MKNIIVAFVGTLLLSATAHSASIEFNAMINEGVKAQDALRETLQRKVGDPQKQLDTADNEVLRIANSDKPATVPQNLELTSAQRELTDADDDFVDEFVDDELLGISEF